MKGDPEERAAAVGRYIVESGATVRAAAAVFGVSKSTIWKDQHRLRRQNPGLWAEVQAVVQKNKAERHLRGSRPHSANICIQHLARRMAAQYNRVKNKGRCTYETSGLHQLG